MKRKKHTHSDKIVSADRAERSEIETDEKMGDGVLPVKSFCFYV